MSESFIQIIEMGISTFTEALNNTELAQANTASIIAKNYDAILNAGQAQLQQDTNNIDPNSKDAGKEQTQYTTDSQKWQNYGSICSDFLNSWESNVSNTAQTYTQVDGSLTTSFLSAFFDYINSLIAKG